MRELIMKLKDAPKIVGRKWANAILCYVQLERWQKVNWIRWGNVPRYVLSEVIQLVNYQSVWMKQILVTTRLFYMQAST